MFNTKLKEDLKNLNAYVYKLELRITDLELKLKTLTEPTQNRVTKRGRKKIVTETK